MAKLRKKSRALRHGGCHVLHAEGDVVVFVRVLQQERVLVAINRGQPCEVVLTDLPLLNVSAWHSKEGTGTIDDGVLSLPAQSASVWAGN